MKKILLTLGAAVVVTTTLIACANTMTGPRPRPHYSYSQYPATILGVSNIQVVEAFSSPMAQPNAEHLMPDPLPQAVAQWARTRFKAGGGDGTLVITVNDASVIQKNLQRTPGVKGWFTVDQAERYDAHIQVTFAVEGTTTSGTSGSGSVNVNRGQTIAEDASLQDRDRTWTSMAEAMLTDLDAGAQQMLAQKLAFLLQK
jgi:hypothetical protein